jgi:hypothetical protein
MMQREEMANGLAYSERTCIACRYGAARLRCNPSHQGGCWLCCTLHATGACVHSSPLLPCGLMPLPALIASHAFWVQESSFACAKGFSETGPSLPCCAGRQRRYLPRCALTWAAARCQQCCRLPANAAARHAHTADTALHMHHLISTPAWPAWQVLTWQ